MCGGEGKGVSRSRWQQKKKWRTVTPDIGTDTKSLIWPVGFFLQVDETPFPRAGIPPLLCILSEYARGKKNAATLYPVTSPLLTSDPPEKKTLRTVISGTNIFLIDTYRARRERIVGPGFPTRRKRTGDTRKVVVQTNTPVDVSIARDLRIARQFRALTVKMGCATSQRIAMRVFRDSWLCHIDDIFL